MSRKSRRSNSPLARLFRRLQWAHHESERTGMPVDELLDLQREQERLANSQRQQRRDFLKTLGAGVAGASLLGGLSPALAAMGGQGNGPGRVIVIGAGLAGLRCAHRLKQYGYGCTLYEGNTRIGGRAFTTRDFFDDGMAVERGGELVSTEHSALRNLVNQLGLSLEDVNSGGTPGSEELYRVNGQLYREDQLAADWRLLKDLFKRTQQAAPWQPTYNANNAEHRRLDVINVPDWLDQTGIGRNSNFGQLMQADVISEYGHTPQEQTCLNLVYLMASNSTNEPLPLAGTDERFHIVGGNDSVVYAMANQLAAGSIVTGKRLTSISGSAMGPYVCGFADGSTDICDQLVLALPFSKLREVDISPEIRASFAPAKRLAIAEMTLGSNAKIHIQCGSRPWNAQRQVGGELVQMGGVSYSGADGFVTVWDTQVGKPTTGSVLSNFLGGQQGRALSASVPFQQAASQDVNRLLGQIEPVFPGTSAAYQGKALVSKWPINPWSGGSYAAPMLGHYTRFWGAQWEKDVGNRIHFCGEHCSQEYWGFLNGAVETGELAAQALVQG
ncbi:monoamine oxidase [Pseudomonas alcaligenes]|uniref:Tryptophan 2-monooxygenase n=1 Tax=Aquipseudomonas alcaligenes TaxID=43263 RepID=A0ABR7RW54_AQUAC|nr:NAD(P)/FAD-dependent oxidoreductase [Pseudomonas alcaligenes]MBC9249368.1 monoamine oxidase [Pseudomonas alcaligenes]